MTTEEDVKRTQESTVDRIERETREAKAKLQASEPYQSWKGNRYTTIFGHRISWGSKTRFLAVGLGLMFVVWLVAKFSGWV